MKRPIRTGTDEAKYSRVLPARLADAFIIDSKRRRDDCMGRDQSRLAPRSFIVSKHVKLV